jgi:hypothetical protein
VAVSKRLRFEIFRRDNHACRYCGATAPDVPLRIDHVTPVALGGTDVPENLVTACEPCNSGKTSTTPGAPLVADVASDALRWSQAMQLAASVMAEKEAEKLAYRDAFKAAWDRWGRGEGKVRKPLPLPDEWRQSIERFRVAGLPASVWEEFIDTAMTKKHVTDTFRYMCGIAWRQIDQLQAIAREHLAEQDGMDPQAPPSEAALVEAVVWHWASSQGDPGEEGWPTAERIAAFRESVPDVLANYSLSDVIEGAEHAAWYPKTRDDLEGGIDLHKTSERDMARYEAASVWAHAYTQAGGGGPSAEQHEAFWTECEALYEAGVPVTGMLAAAAVAGVHQTVHVHFGLSSEALEHTDVLWFWQEMENVWARTWHAAADSKMWPSDDQRACFRASLSKVAGRGFKISDGIAAAASTGAYLDASVSPHLPRAGSVFEAAALCGRTDGA